jgi:hypothetical protein
VGEKGTGAVTVWVERDGSDVETGSLVEIASGVNSEVEL